MFRVFPMTCWKSKKLPTSWSPYPDQYCFAVTLWESIRYIYIYILKLAQIMELEAGCPVNSRKCWIWSNNKSLKCECLCRWFRGPTLKLQEHYIPCKKAYITLLYIYLQRPKHVSKLKHLVNWRYLVKTHRKQFDQTTILCTFRGEPLEFKFVGLNIK